MNSIQKCIRLEKNWHQIKSNNPHKIVNVIYSQVQERADIPRCFGRLSKYKAYSVYTAGNIIYLAIEEKGDELELKHQKDS